MVKIHYPIIAATLLNSVERIRDVYYPVCRLDIRLDNRDERTVKFFSPSPVLNR